MVLEIIAIILGVISLIAGLIKLEHHTVSVIFAIYYIFVGIGSFPYFKENRNKISLATGCIFFVLSGVLTIIYGGWWFISTGAVGAFGTVAFISPKGN